MSRLVSRLASRPDAVPLLAAAMLLLLGAQVALVFKVPSWGNDEPAHMGYVASLAEGRLPTIETDIVDDPARFPGTAEELRGWDEEHGDVWTANHPPLFPLAMVPVWWALSDHQSAMVITMRLANTLGFAFWLYLVGALARELVPRRPAVAALAVVVAAAPTLVLRSAFFQNDGWASASAVLLFLVTVRMVRDRVTPQRVAVAAAAGTVAVGMRTQGVLVVALCALTLLVVLWRRWGPTGPGRCRAAAVAAVVGVVPAAAFGWFFVRNLLLYGDLTGQAALLEKFERSPVTSWAGIADIPGVVEPIAATPIPLVVALVLVPAALVGSVRRHGVRPDPVWILLGVHAALTLHSVVGFLRVGGGLHDRYLMQSMPVLATAVAVGMLGVGRWWAAAAPGTPAAERRDWWVASAWSAVLLAWLAGTLAWLLHHHVFSRQASSPVDGPVPDVLAVLGACAGAAVLAVLVRSARGMTVQPTASRAGPTTRSSATRTWPREDLLDGGPPSTVDVRSISARRRPRGRRSPAPRA
ncbi:hypothetical protein [Nocardioides renjunii]|uniref:hypothetical protein n=1 Tax=Nocardioides renjunii TaxID=3095075 RepID=UPI002AFE9FEC|nr:hypothetical protein [Nocardioides sp. S-34]WQQ21143.1 hypothetical protein SHK17_14690 [Nocardioides sp. S-34]